MLDLIIREGRANRVVEIAYTDSKGFPTIREIEPYELRGNDLYGYCLSRNSIRRFDINKITNVRATGRSFSPKWPIQL